MKNILIAGGAGYIGSHVCRYLYEHGYLPVIIDDMSKGHADVVKKFPIYTGDFSDSSLLAEIQKKYNCIAAMHFAALSIVPESVKNPAEYYSNNVEKTIRFLTVLKNIGIMKLVFSSTAAVFGNPEYTPIDETHPQNPLNPYGRSKLMIEQIIQDFSAAYGMHYGILRYFNAAGAWPDGSMGELHNPETHLIPIILDTARGKRECIKIFGTDYNTPDGTCIRDYIHVCDLARAHHLVLERIQTESCVYNLGNGAGFSVRQVISATEKVTGKIIRSEEAPRRPGDPDILIASSELIMKELAFTPHYTALSQIIEHAWNHRRLIS